MKKLVILALALAMASAFAFSACGGKTPSPTVTPSVSTTPSVTPTAECEHDFKMLWVVEEGAQGELSKVLYECSKCEKQEYRMEVIAPSALPSVEESVEPSAVPSVEPSVEPTVEETVAPTVEPSVEESVEPSVIPSATPSVEPTVEPSVEPTIEPSVTPSVEEKATIVLTNEETGETESISVAAGEAIGALPVPEAENKDFAGWYDAETRKVKLCETDTFLEDETATFVAIFVAKNGIEFSGDIVYSGVAQTAGAVATVTTQGVYVVSGSSENGQIVVNAPASIVQLTLNNLTLTCATSAPVYVEEADKVIVYVPDQTETVLQDTNRNGAKPRGVLHSKDDMNILGTGTLRIVGNNYSAIRCGADLSIEETTLIASAVDHAVSADGEMELNANVTVESANGDGIRTEYINSEKAKKGNLIIAGGEVTVTTTAGDAFDVAKNVTITGGTVKAFAGNPKAAAPTADNAGNKPSRKGIKANGTMTISGGEITVESNDDGINLGGNAEDVSGAIVALAGAFEMTGGTLTVTAGCDGINCSGSVSVTNATLTVTAGNALNNIDFVKQRGIKAGGDITITNSTVVVVGKDDGINCADGTMTISGGSVKASSQKEESLQAYKIVLKGGARVACYAKKLEKCVKYTMIDTTDVGQFIKEIYVG